MRTPASLRPARTGSMRVAPWQRQRLGAADKVAIMDAARRLERRSHQTGRHGGCLGRTGIIVLWTLLYRGFSRHGVCDPALSQVAAEAQMARSTVQLAIARIEAAGIMGHVRRGLAVAGRWCQWTSAYIFANPATWPASDTESRSALESSVRKRGLRGGAPAASALSPEEVAALAARWGLAEPAAAA